MIRIPARRLLLAIGLAPALVLGACHGGAATQKSAAGEVLSGSVSDAMLPLDTATSQPPRAAGTAGDGADSGDDTGDIAPEDAATTAATASKTTGADPAAPPPG